MDIVDIIKMYGKTDYYEMITSRIFHLSQMFYDKQNDCTVIPVTVNGLSLGYCHVKGDYTK